MSVFRLLKQNTETWHFICSYADHCDAYRDVRFKPYEVRLSNSTSMFTAFYLCSVRIWTQTRLLNSQLVTTLQSGKPSKRLFHIYALVTRQILLDKTWRFTTRTWSILGLHSALPQVGMSFPATYTQIASYSAWHLQNRLKFVVYKKAWVWVLTQKLELGLVKLHRPQLSERAVSRHYPNQTASVKPQSTRCRYYNKQYLQQLQIQFILKIWHQTKMIQCLVAMSCRHTRRHWILLFTTTSIAMDEHITPTKKVGTYYPMMSRNSAVWISTTI